MAEIHRPGRLAAIALTAVTILGGCGDRQANGIQLVDCNSRDANGQLIGPTKGTLPIDIPAGNIITVGGSNGGVNVGGIDIISKGNGIIRLDAPGDIRTITIAKNSDGSLLSIQPDNEDDWSLNPNGDIVYMDGGRRYDIKVGVGPSKSTHLDIVAQCTNN